MSRTAGTDPELTPHPTSLIGRLRALSEAARHAEAALADARSGPVNNLLANVRLLETADEVSSTARPVIAKATFLSEALRDAAADRRDVPDWCRACREAPGDLCGDHHADVRRAEVYDLLHRLIFEGTPIRF